MSYRYVLHTKKGQVILHREMKSQDYADKTNNRVQFILIISKSHIL